MISTLVRISRPIHLLFTAMTYTLGAGIARYLGSAIDWPVYWVGFIAVLALQASPLLLVEYFRLPLTPRSSGESTRQRELYQIRLLQVSYAALTFFGVAVLTLFLTHSLTLSSGILLVLDLLILIAYSVPPASLTEKGYGELILAFVIAMLVPAIGYLLQAEKFHRLLPMITFPLMLMALSYLLAACFPIYDLDQNLGHQTLLTRLSWQRAIPIHHILILAGFLLYAAAPFTGIPWRVVGPVFLILPFAVFQIIWLQHIASGGRTLWKFFVPLAASVFGLVVYLLALTFWIR